MSLDYVGHRKQAELLCQIVRRCPQPEFIFILLYRDFALAVVPPP